MKEDVIRHKTLQQANKRKEKDELQERRHRVIHRPRSSANAGQIMHGIPAHCRPLPHQWLRIIRSNGWRRSLHCHSLMKAVWYKFLCRMCLVTCTVSCSTSGKRETSSPFPLWAPVLRSGRTDETGRPPTSHSHPGFTYCGATPTGGMVSLLPCGSLPCVTKEGYGVA